MEVVAQTVTEQVEAERRVQDALVAQQRLLGLADHAFKNTSGVANHAPKKLSRKPPIAATTRR
ncbi:MAG TPA: hypothetical protein VGK54_03640 [Chloroflexota bacterium]